MKNIYIDSNFKCHFENPTGEYREFDVPFFDGKCAAFIEGYRYIPTEEFWTRSDGVVFHGEMIAPYKDFSELDAIQREYEKQTINEYNQVLQELGVEVNS